MYLKLFTIQRYSLFKFNKFEIKPNLRLAGIQALQATLAITSEGKEKEKNTWFKVN